MRAARHSRTALPRRPTKAQLAAAEGRRVADVIAPRLAVLFCGINPGLYSGAVGHHFARPGNRFWKALHLAGLTDRALSPFEEREFLAFRLGVTNLVNRATATAAALSREELRGGARVLERKVRRHRPACVAFVGLGAYRVAFGRPGARIGQQQERIAAARIWLLPNPSGLNASYQLPTLVRQFRALREAAFGGKAGRYTRPPE